MDVYYPIDGGTDNYVQGKFVFDGSTFKFFAGQTSATAATNGTGQVYDSNVFASSVSNYHSTVTTIESLGGSSFVVRLANTKTGSPANFTAYFGVSAWG